METQIPLFKVHMPESVKDPPHQNDIFGIYRSGAQGGGI